MKLMHRNPIYPAKKDWIFSRTACLGNEIYELLNLECPRLNIQKGRSDYLISLLNNRNDEKARSRSKFFNDPDIAKIVRQQENLKWLEYTPPKAIILDSFSDLTDQKFGWGKSKVFFANYGDVKRNYLERKIQNLGLIPEEEFELQYKELFTALRKKWGNLPIIFLHYPTYKEEREIFLSRAETILETTTKFAVNDQNLHNVYLKSGFIDPDDDKFPYHYSIQTHRQLLNSVKPIIISGSVS